MVMIKEASSLPNQKESKTSKQFYRLHQLNGSVKCTYQMVSFHQAQTVFPWWNLDLNQPISWVKS